MKKEYIIPIFVPNLGCPMDCVFCNQKKISGQTTTVNAEDVRNTIEYYLKNFSDESKYVEIAFFGGSFTAIDEEKQNELLEVADEYIKNGKANSIRISTRPDYIDKNILKRLGKLLGQTDVNGQVSEIEVTEEFLSIQIEKAEEEKKKKNMEKLQH